MQLGPTGSEVPLWVEDGDSQTDLPVDRTPRTFS